MDRPNRKAINVAMRACAQMGRWEEALSLLRNMTSRGLAADEWSYNTAIHACAQAGESEVGDSYENDEAGRGSCYAEPL